MREKGGGTWVLGKKREEKRKKKEKKMWYEGILGIVKKIYIYIKK